MVVWVKADAIGKHCDQRAEVIGIKEKLIRVKLCGTDEEALVATSELCGVELWNNVEQTPGRIDRATVSVMFTPTGSKRTSGSSFA